MYLLILGLSRWLSGKESTCQSRRHRRCGFDPWVRKISEGGNGNPLQYSCLENPMDRGAWRATTMKSQRVGHDRAHSSHQFKPYQRVLGISSYYCYTGNYPKTLRYKTIPAGLPCSCGVVENLPANTRDASSIPGSGGSPGGGSDNPL